MTVYIEDLIRISVVGIDFMDNRSASMMESFNEQTTKGMGLTEKQRSAAIRILNQNKSEIARSMSLDISAFLENPQFRLPLREIKVVKQISIISYKDQGRYIKVEFPYDEEKIKIIRAHKEHSDQAFWDQGHTAWIFSLEERNIEFLIRFCENQEFNFDEEFDGYRKKTLDIIKNMQDHIPVLALDKNGPKIVNSPKNLPILTSKDIVSAVFEARKLGILTWDESIAQHITIFHLPESIKEFLTSDYDHVTLIDSQKTPIDCLKYHVSYMSPCLVIVPGGNEFEKITQAYDFLKNQGIENSQISTMFRLPSETGADFNNFVKNNEINGPITEDTKIVFVSTKLPKSVIKSKIRFNCVINMGTHSAHHTIKEFMKNHENVVIFSELTKIKNIRDRQSWLLQGL
jgi:hypothetical protein